MSKFVEIFFVLLFCLLTSLTRLDQFVVNILRKLKGQIQRAIMFQFRSITLFHFYSLFTFSFATQIFSHKLKITKDIL